MGRIADKESLTPDCASVSKGLQQLQAAPQKPLPKNNLFRLYALEPSSRESLAGSVFIQNFKLPSQDREPFPVLRTLLGELFPRGGRGRVPTNARLRMLKSICPRPPLVGQEEGNFNFSVSRTMRGVPLAVDKGPCLKRKTVLQAKAAPLKQNQKAIGKDNQDISSHFPPSFLGL